MSQDGEFNSDQTQIKEAFLSNSDSEDSFTRVGSFSSVSSFVQPSPLPPEILFSPTDSSSPAITLEEDKNPSFKATSWLVSTAVYLGKQLDDATDAMSNNSEIIASESAIPAPLEHTDSGASLDSQAVFDSNPTNHQLERNDSQESVKSYKTKDSGKIKIIIIFKIFKTIPLKNECLPLHYDRGLKLYSGHR